MKWEVMTQEEAIRINGYNKTVPWYKTTMGPYCDSVMTYFTYVHIVLLSVLLIMFLPLVFTNGLLGLIILIVLGATISVSIGAVIWGRRVQKRPKNL